MARGKGGLPFLCPSRAIRLTVADAGLASGLFDCGHMRWLDGENAGLTARIVTSAGPVLTLREPPPFATPAGAPVEITQGCDRRFATCVSRFANAANFRGEPHLPGNDVLVRYGG